MKTLEELKQEMDIARTAWGAADASAYAAWTAAAWEAADVAWTAWDAAWYAHNKRLKEIENEDT